MILIMINLLPAFTFQENVKKNQIIILLKECEETEHECCPENNLGLNEAVLQMPQLRVLVAGLEDMAVPINTLERSSEKLQSLSPRDFNVLIEDLTWKSFHLLSNFNTPIILTLDIK